MHPTATEPTAAAHEPVVSPPFLYRFRRAAALLTQYEELDRQEIRFSLPEGLNDPMEGFKDIFWSGDEIVWRNLFKNYLLCLERVCVLYTMGDRIPLGTKHILVAKTEDSETESARAIFRETCSLFFGDGAISEYPKRLAARRDPVRRDELLLFLSLVHRHALSAIFAAFEKRGYKGGPAEDGDGAARTSRLIANGRELLALANDVHARATDRTHAGAASLLRQERLRLKYNQASTPISPNLSFIWADFPDAYIRELEQLVHPRWSTACFAGRADNPAMWAHYADAHRGVCLKFKTTSSGDGIGIALRGVVSISGNKSGATYGYGDINCRFHKVRYDDRYPEVDFFRTMGRLPQPTLEKDWYRDDAGNVSICAAEILGKTEEWRDRYWAQHHEILTTKLSDWRYEEEYRLITQEVGISMLNPARRTMRYAFRDLDGIIFGINTSDDHKLAIMRIVAQKCRAEGRSDFRFYQAAYSRALGSIEITDMPALRFRQA